MATPRTHLVYDDSNRNSYYGATYTPFPGWEGTQPKIWVVNPMHIITLTDATKSKIVRIVEIFKSFTEKWFSHILLLLFLLIYGCIGAWIFMTLEGNHESGQKQAIRDIRKRIGKDLYFALNRYHEPEKYFLQRVDHRLREYELQVREAFQSGVTSDTDVEIWGFWNSLFYSTTIFTTIGYGHIVPITMWGKIATMIYAFIGIPILLLVLADLGKVLTRIIKYAVKYVRMLFFAKKFKKMRRAGRRATAVPNQLAAWAVRRKTSKQTELDNEANEINAEYGPDNNTLFVRSPGPVAYRISDDGKTPIILTNPTPPETAYIESRPGSPLIESRGHYEVDDEFNLPVSLALIILLVYMMLGALIFHFTDDWGYVDSFYFIYISMSTIGFGDLVPKDALHAMYAFMYLLFGLALTSMCINVVQEKLDEIFKSARVHIGARMGLDVQLATPVAPDGSGEKSRSGSKERGKSKERSRERSQEPANKSSKDKTKDKNKKDDKKNRKDDKNDDKKNKKDDKKDKNDDKKNVGFTLKKDRLGEELKERRDRKKSISPSEKDLKTSSDEDNKNQDHVINIS